MSSFPHGEQFVGIIREERTGTTLRDQVGRLFEEARDDVYRYLLTLGLHPPRAQEAAQEVFLRLYATQQETPESELIERQRMSRFHSAVESLSEQQRRCLFLRMEGLRYPEIGSTLGISASAVGEFLRRAMVRLKKVRYE